jgi:hypothetical protein
MGHSVALVLALGQRSNGRLALNDVWVDVTTRRHLALYAEAASRGGA